MQKLFKITLAGIVATSVATIALAQDYAALAALPKDDFLERYEDMFIDAMSVQKELLERVRPGMGDALDDGPMTDEERAAVECTYDTMAAQNQIDTLAEHLYLFDVLASKVEADPELDFVSVAFDEELSGQFGGNTNEALLAAMSSCGSIAASQKRMNMTPDMWAVFGQEAQARGLVD